MSSSLFSSEIDEEKKVAARLEQRSAVVERAVQRRDNVLYNFLAKLHGLDKRLRKTDPDEARQALKRRYKDEVPRLSARKPKSAHFLLKFTYPTLDPKPRSKYAAVLRYVRAKRKPEQSVQDFVRANGGINGCVAKEKKLREKKKRKASDTK